MNVRAYQELLHCAQYSGVYTAAQITGLENLPVQISATMNAKLGKADNTAEAFPAYDFPGFWDHLGANQTAAESAAEPKTKAFTRSFVAPETIVSHTSKPRSPTKSNSTSTTPSASGCAAQNATSDVSTGQASSTGGRSLPSRNDEHNCTESVTVQDEGLYWWDVGVGVPFRSYKELQVSNGSVTSTTISRQTAFGS